MEPNNIKKPIWYCESSKLPLDDQEWIWKNIPNTDKDNSNESVSVNRSVNGTYKSAVKKELNLSKPQLIVALRGCTHKTPPIDVASHLEHLFGFYESKPGHWLFVAQNWPPRAINRVLTNLLTQHQRGEVTIKNPAAYFTHLLKFRKKRKGFASTYGVRNYKNI
jgi:hypothetical protein